MTRRSNDMVLFHIYDRIIGTRHRMSAHPAAHNNEHYVPIMSFPRRRESRILLKSYFVYIMASTKNGTLYIGVTSDLIKRVYEHKSGNADVFTSKYRVNKLVYFEQTTDIQLAIQREKQVKKWNRKLKIRLIEEHNPKWDDLYEGIV